MKWIAAILAAAALLSLVSTGARSQDRGLDGLIQELESIIAAEKARRDHDQALVARLEGLVRRYRGNAGGNGGEAGGAEEAPARGAPGGGGGWGVDRILDRVIGEVDLTEEERALVVRILGEFYESWQLILRHQDAGSLPEIEKDRDNRLVRAVGRRRAKDISGNIDEIVQRWSRWGGRGGGR